MLSTLPTDEQLKKLSLDKLKTELATKEEGLTEQEVQLRLKEFGQNLLEEKEEMWLFRFLGYFWGPIPWMIELAALLSFLVGHIEELCIIVFLLLFNAFIGFFEEHKAQNALQALKKGLAVKARVKREGVWQEVAVSSLVPGDILRLRLGDILPADVVCTEGEYLTVDQSALTGESLPLSKAKGDLAYSGSIVKQGEMEALVVRTGSHTFFGRTAHLVAQAGSTSHFQQAVLNIGDFLIGLALLLAALLACVQIYRGVDLLELLEFILVLIIAAIPVAMPAVLSVTMALGAVVLSRQKAIVSRLQAIEELAGIDILCSDKTGTLTKNELTLGEIVPRVGVLPEELLQAAALASKAEDVDPIDLAILQHIDQEVVKGYTTLHFTPFDPVQKRTESVVEKGGVTWHMTKGAPQTVLALVSVSETEQKTMLDQVEAFAEKGYRTLAVAAKKGEEPWQYLGLLPLFDPPREDAKETIQRAKEHGLSVKMVTGDHISIATEMAKKLSLEGVIYDTKEFFSEGSMSLTAEQKEKIAKAGGFAEVYPEHKYAIVEVLQDLGHYVIMTGDGVNDAPALKQADTGIAVSGALEAARAAASVILTKPGLSVIIDAIEEARRIFLRMESYTIYRVAMTMDIMFFVVLSMLFVPTLLGTPFQPLTAVMIILLALLDDIPIMTIAYDNTELPKAPVRFKMKELFTLSSVLGIASVFQTFFLFLLGVVWVESQEGLFSLSKEQLQTLMFLQLVIGGHLLLFLTRTKKSFYTKPLPSLLLTSAILGTQMLALCFSLMGWFVPAVPLSIIGFVWGYNLVMMVLLDQLKKVTYKWIQRQTKPHVKFLQRLQQRMHPYPTLGQKRG